MSLSPSERAKIAIFAGGIDLTLAARRRLSDATAGRAATPADYASTSGLILELDGETWVNAPIAEHNSSFVDHPTHELDWDGTAFSVRTPTSELGARVWLPPAFHDEIDEDGVPYTTYGYTHSDRLRISPIAGCSMACKFCDLPYKFRYQTKPGEALVRTVERALADPVQPAGHVLISGGTPRGADIGYLRDVYELVLTKTAPVPVDIMMAPVGRLLGPEWLAASGVNELSVNIELVDDATAKAFMPHKHRIGLASYLAYVERASEVLGGNRVRSMLMVGLEPVEATLEGVRLIAERGGVPVLSPFRPDDATPLRDQPPPSATMLEEVYLRALTITNARGISLGPSCVPCTHNTLTFAASGSGSADQWHAHPTMV